MIIVGVLFETMKETELNKISGLIIGAAIDVHKEVGPGLLESVYEECLYFELVQLGLKVERQVELPINYKGNKLRGNLRLDLLVEDEVIVELKSVDKIHPIHRAQIITYLKLSNRTLGLLINFNETLLKHGVERFRN